ncbi:Gfo/Idh/MocA family protein [Paenibacillus ihbetae]|uniref:Oxidoreductase n=1 Tax=Paenibacillus ihbetae TaxID=1870820 RepID=A0ABX3JYG3_9BACL|nr:Gfo/Idh/MocA family oxidoreductase [Paenibacillus ihbetae]OOC62461.1 oxidoreductase [Paenibacillus ihbetae]
MNKINIGIIGTGFGAEVHAPIFRLYPGFHLKSIASVYRGRHGATKHSLRDIAFYSNWREMLESEELDLVSIASTPAQHYDMALQALRTGHHVLIEKPLAMNAGQTLELVEEASRLERHAFVNFLWRLTPLRQRIKSMLDQRMLGRIQHIRYCGSFSGYSALAEGQRGWEGRREEGGGFLFAVGSHMIDSLMWWMGEEIAEVQGDLRTHIPGYEGSDGREVRNADDAFSFTGRFRGGASLAVDVFLPGRTGTGWRLEIYGDEGTLVMRDDRILEFSRGGALEPVQIESTKPPEGLTVPALHYYNGFYPMLDSIYRSLTDKPSMLEIPNVADGHRTQVVMDAVLRSSDTGSRVRIDLSPRNQVIVTKGEH